MAKNVTSKTTPPKITARQREVQAMQLRATGATYEQIADALGYTQRDGAYKAVVRGIRREGEEYHESIEFARSLSLNRLDELLFAIYPAAKSGDRGAIDQVLRLEQRRANLLGLDAPKTFEAKIKLDVMAWNQALRDILDVYREIHGTLPETDEFLDKLDMIANERYTGVV
jgi:hypothetical protein